MMLRSCACQAGNWGGGGGGGGGCNGRCVEEVCSGEGTRVLLKEGKLDLSVTLLLTMLALVACLSFGPLLPLYCRHVASPLW